MVSRGLTYTTYFGIASLGLTVIQAFGQILFDSQASGNKVLNSLTAILYGGLATLLFFSSTVSFSLFVQLIGYWNVVCCRYHWRLFTHPPTQQSTLKCVRFTTDFISCTPLTSTGCSPKWLEWMVVRKLFWKDLTTLMALGRNWTSSTNLETLIILYLLLVSINLIVKTVGSYKLFLAPYSPRLDWQMHWAAFNTYEKEPWVLSLTHRILLGQPEVLSLLDRNHSPFVKNPPKYIRAALYKYKYTPWNQRWRSITVWFV